MKNQTNRILLTFLIMSIVLIFNGCPANPTQNNQNNDNQRISNQNTSNEKISDKDNESPLCTEVDESKIRNAIPDDLKKQLDKKFLLSYSADTQVLTLKGFIYSDFSVWQKLINNLDNFRSPKCVRVVSFEGNENNKKFKWCLDSGCSGKVPDAIACSNPVVDQLFNDSLLGDQLSSSGDFSKEYNRGNDAGMELLGFVRDAPNKTKFSSLFLKLAPKVNKCITNITFEQKKESETPNSLRRGFEWQICEGKQCEYNGNCVDQPCLTKDDNTNTK